MRGGGAGSWGVIIDATLRTFPTFNATLHTVNVLTDTLSQTANLMTTHAMHVKDWDAVKAGQYFYLSGSALNTSTLVISTLFKDLDGNASKAQMSPFLNDARALGAVVENESTNTAVANDIVGLADDASGFNLILSSRLIPASVYLDSPGNVGAAYKQILSQGIPQILGHLVAGGVLSFPFFLPRVFAMIYHSRRPSRRQCQYQFGHHPSMAVSKDPCGCHFWMLRISDLTRLTR
jgi:hypothetical protein